MMRTYSGHSSARASNELYRMNLAKGQTGLSIAFDLPTQTGYDPDSPLAKGEVGKVGVPVVHLGHMETLLDGIPVGEMNTSMTINATAAWLFGLYVANAERQGVETKTLRGTTQNDIVKEYLSRGTYIYPPLPSRRLIVDMFAFCQEWVPHWNPMNVCSYHLQEAGATPVQEIAYSLATAIGVLDAVRDSGQVAADRMPSVVASISFFVNSGIRFVEETCKMRAFTAMWDRLCLDRYGVTDPKARRFRYGVQVNSLGLTEAQPENNVPRIVLEALGVTLSKRARARSMQLPAWNEALGLPRPWDQQWSLRIQQVLAYETDLLEYEDIFDGSKVIEARTAELEEAAQAELDEVLELGGAFEAIDELKGRLVRSNAERVRRIETGDLKVIGVNAFTETADSPLGGDDNILRVDPTCERELVADVHEWRSNRDADAVKRSLEELRRVARSGENVMPATIDLAHAGGTTGEWAGDPAGGVRRVPGPHRRSRRLRRRWRLRPPPGRGRAGQAAAGRPTPVPRGEARARRPLERRRADRGRRPRRRHGGRVPGHTAHARADRGRRPRRRRRRGRPVDPVGQPPRDRPRDRPAAPGRGCRRAGRRRWHHPRGGPTSPSRRRRRCRVHPEGLRARPHHVRDPRPRRRRRLT